MPLFLLLLVIFSIGPASASVNSRISVNLFESHAPANRLNVDGPFHVFDSKLQSVPPGKYYFQGDGTLVHLRNASNSPPLKMDSREFTIIEPNGIRMQYSTSKVRRYNGKIKIRSDRSLLLIQNKVPSLDYVRSVVGSEGYPGYPLESSKALALLTLTRLAKLRPDEVIGDSTQQQSYFGMDYDSSTAKAAVQAVWGKVLTYRNQPIQIFYHSTCAGGTSKGSDIFGDGAKNMPYLTCVKCRYCSDSNFWKPTRTLIALNLFESEFGSIPEINERDCAERPILITLRKSGVARDRSGYQFWMRLGQRFGWDKAPGLRFRLRKVGSNIEVESTGAGHGVGLCQWGAAGLAKQGKTCEQILQYYFPGTSITQL